MKKEIVSALGIIVLLTSAVAAQKLDPPKLEPTPSTESQKQLINEGVALHDKGDYDAAISRYEQVLRENPNNVEAFYEMSFSYFAKKDCNKSLEIAYKAAQYRSNLLGAIYGQIGNCLDDLGKPKDAIEIYKSGLKLLPTDYLLQYNLAVTYSRMGQLDDARAAVKKSATLNPNHPSSQHLLSSLFDKGGYKIPALLAASRFLVLEPTSRRSEGALGIVHKVMQAGVSPKSEKEISIVLDASPQKKDEGDFSSADMFMGLAKAANYTEENKDKTQVRLLADNFESLFAFLAESTNKADRSKFTWQYYLPYFLEMKTKGHVETFAYYINQRSSLPGVKEWLDQNKSKVDDFLSWSKAYRWPKTD